MNKLLEFTNKYSLSKTLRFKLEPVGRTSEYIKRAQIIEEDESRATYVIKMKEIMDDYHKNFIDNVLSRFSFSNSLLSELYNELSSGDSNNRSQNIAKILGNLRKEVAKAFSNAKANELKKKEFINVTLKELHKCDPEKSKVIEKFEGFTTYFIPYNTNRQNMYVADDKSTSIANRVVNQNLIKFIDNIHIFQKIVTTLPAESIEQISDNFASELCGRKLDSLFALDNYSDTLTQQQIATYNAIIGGKKEEGEKTLYKGLNQYVNEYNATHKDGKLPKLNRLFNQILSDRVSLSETFEPFTKASQAIDSINNAYNMVHCKLHEMQDMLLRLTEYNLEGVYIGADFLQLISQRAYGDYSHIRNLLSEQWQALNPRKSKSEEKYKEAEKKYIKSVASLSLKQIENLCGDDKVMKYLLSLGARNDETRQCENIFAQVENNHTLANEILSNRDVENSYFRANSTLIKPLLDSIKEALAFVRPLLGSGNENNRDDVFYSDFVRLYEEIDCVIAPLYNKVRNFVTKKEYSTNKFKINFGIGYFLSGWGVEYEKNAGFIFLKDNQYYLGVVGKMTNEDIAILEDGNPTNTAQRVEYLFQKPDMKNNPRIFIRSKGENFAPAVEKYKLPIYDILEIYDKGWFKTEYRKQNPSLFKQSLVKMIDYYKLGFSRHESFSCFNFNWKNSSDYNDISEFYNDVIASCYKLEFKTIDWDRLCEYASDGRFYLFRITGKDFSPNSKGLPNLHTIYWKMLFDPENIKDVVYKLSGNAEIFYRRASIPKDKRVIHNANRPIENKNPFSQNRTSTFDYDIIKDRRYTRDQFEFHVPIMLNYKQNEPNKFNKLCLDFMRENHIPHIIGIDRGERNLLYLVVLNDKGEIVEQRSLNQIQSNPLIPEFKQDYHQLIEKKVGANDESRKNWTAIENIKEMKEGYMSQIVHEIAKLMIKYNAIVVLENLNTQFMQKRGIERSIYQKFEKMLIDKLGYLVDKTKQPNEPGGAFHALQLADTFANFNKYENGSVRQCGFIFYIPAWCTSKIDPATGFVSMLRCKYESGDKAKLFFSQFSKICYDANEDLFSFTFNYDNFKVQSKYGKRCWTAYTYGERIHTHRDKKQNNNFVSESISLTAEFKNLFAEYGIDIAGNLKESITAQTEAKFFERLMMLMRLTLQMRNSSVSDGLDYIISPIKAADGIFFDSRTCPETMPKDADANGAYNIARKGLILLNQLYGTPENEKFKPNLSNEIWLKFAQK